MDFTRICLKTLKCYKCPECGEATLLKEIVKDTTYASMIESIQSLKRLIGFDGLSQFEDLSNSEIIMEKKEPSPPLLKNQTPARKKSAPVTPAKADKRLSKKRKSSLKLFEIIDQGESYSNEPSLKQLLDNNFIDTSVRISCYDCVARVKLNGNLIDELDLMEYSLFEWVTMVKSSMAISNESKITSKEIGNMVKVNNFWLSEIWARFHSAPHKGKSTGSVCILSTSLDADQKEILETTIHSLKVSSVSFKLKSDYSSDVTHVLCNSKIRSDGKRICPRTLKYLCGVLSGKWILDFEWYLSCLSSETLVDESNFEIFCDQTIEDNLLDSNGITLNKNIQGIFAGMNFNLDLLPGNLKKDLSCLINLGSGKVVSDKDFKKNSSLYLITEKKIDSNNYYKPSFILDKISRARLSVQLL